MMNQEISSLIAKLENNLREASSTLYDIKQKLSELEPSTTEKLLAKSVKIQIAAPTLKPIITDPGDPIDYKTNDWPLAADPYTIVSNKNDIERRMRAMQIVSLCDIKTGTKVLDFGCGDAFSSREFAEKSQSTVGYDIRKHVFWDDASCKEYINNKSLILTTDQDIVQSHAPYDHIIMYDVLDHIETEDPVSILKWLKSMLTDTGKLFVRTHPWTSRHGGHLYESNQVLGNKAYLHLALTPDELTMAGLTVLPNIRVTRPFANYDSMFDKSGLKTISRRPHTRDVEQYIIDNMLDRIIKITWNGEVNRETAVKIMTTMFIDYTLG